MTPRRQLATALAAVGLAVTSAASAAPATRALFTLHDARLTEVSGLAVGITSPGVDYVENDSGDSARFFALDGTTGDVLAEYHVPGATNVDWEDPAVAPDAHGVPSVWLADIGDNAADRAAVTVYRVDEPHVHPGQPPGVRTTAAPQTWRLTYPDGPHNAESLAVTPKGVAYVITKETNGVDGVYRLPPAPAADGATEAMTRVGTLTIPAALPVQPALLATGAAISADGTRLVVRTYLAAYVWTLNRSTAGGPDPVGQAVMTAPEVVALPVQPQGEAVTFNDGDDELLIASEQVNSSVYAVFLPGQADPSSPAVATTRRASGTPLASTSSSHRAPWPWILLGVLAVALLAAGVVVRQGGAARRERR